MVIIKPLSTNVNIASAASDVSSAKLVSIINTETTVVTVTVSNGNEVNVAAGERILLEKETSETISSTGSNVFASKVAYKN